jgi:hypothetical protein
MSRRDTLDASNAGVICAMMPAAKHGDPQLGVDIHLCVVPPSPSPVPLPTPHISVVFDPFDYIPYIGATVTVCGMKRATAGTNGMAVHIPPGFPFAPKLPDKDDELFMGSATVVADGDPFSFIAVPVLGCQVAGMLSIPRLKKKGSGKKTMLLPTTFNLAIPTTVFVGGPPTISLMGMAFKAGFKALGKFAKSGLFKRVRQRVFRNMKPGFLKCKVLRAEPVNILTGEVAVEQEDFTLPGRIPIEWVRSYTSGSHRSGACGYGWETLADIRLEVDSVDGSVALRHPTVGPLFFSGLPAAIGEDASELELMDVRGSVITAPNSASGRKRIASITSRGGWHRLARRALRSTRSGGLPTCAATGWRSSAKGSTSWRFRNRQGGGSSWSRAAAYCAKWCWWTRRRRSGTCSSATSTTKLAIWCPWSTRSVTRIRSATTSTI